MSGLIKVVVDDLSQVNQSSLLQLDLNAQVHLDPGGMHDAQVPDVELVALLDYHELTLPQLLIIGNLIMIVVALSYLELSQVSIEGDDCVLELIGVNIDEPHLELLGRWLVCVDNEGLLV